MSTLIRFFITTLALVLLSSSSFANCGADHSAADSSDERSACFCTNGYRFPICELSLAAGGV